MAKEKARNTTPLVEADGSGGHEPYVRSAQLPNALAAGGGIKVEGVAGGVAQPVSGPLTDAELRASAIEVTGIDPLDTVTTNESGRDAAKAAIDNILDTLGAENIKLFLPMWEASGTKAYDLLNRDLTFTINGATLAQDSPAWPVMSFDGVNDYLIQDAVTEHDTDTATQELPDPDAEAAQKLEAIVTKVGFVRLRLIKEGAPDGSVKVEIRESKDGAAISNGTSETLPCSSIGTSAESRGFYFATAPGLSKGTTYYLALVYDGNTNADADNNIGWRYDAAGGYGRGRHYFDGSTWTDTAGEDYRFGLWNDALVLDEDWSILTVLTGVTDLVDRYAFNFTGMTTLITCAFHHRSVGYDSFRANDGTERQVTSYEFPSESNVVAVTFSKSKDTGKVAGYRYGRLVNTANGTATNAVVRAAQPLCIGGRIALDGTAALHWQGKIGPFIINSSELSAANVAKVSHELLALRKLQEAI